MRATVLRPVDKGIVLDLGNDIEGFAPVSQMGIGQEQNPEDAVVITQQVIAKVLEVDPIHHRVVVAIIEYPADGIPAPEVVAAAKAAAEAKAAAANNDDDEDAIRGWGCGRCGEAGRGGKYRRRRRPGGSGKRVVFGAKQSWR